VTGPYDPAVVGAIQSVVKHGMTYVDGSAHIGYMTLVMARAAGPAGRYRFTEIDRAHALAIPTTQPRSGTGSAIEAEEACKLAGIGGDCELELETLPALTAEFLS